MVPLTLLVMLIFTLMHSAVADAARWLPPLRPVAVAGTFDFDARTPFAAGSRRGVRLAGEPGQVVLAPCSGRVRFAGRVPRLGSGVSLRCGRLAATEFGLERPRVGRGAVVIAGAPVGTLGPRGMLLLGARAASDRWGYRDPLALLGGARDRPLGPAPLPLRVRVRRPGASPPVAAPVRAATPSPLPLAAWVGAGIAGVGSGLGVTLRRRTRRNRSRGAAPLARSSGGTG